MRKVILQEFVTMDGFAAGLRDNIDFVPASTRNDDSIGSEQLKLIRRIDTMLLGRKTYEMFASYWPKVTKGKEKPFADKLNALRKTVFTKTLTTAPWGKWVPGRIVRDSPVKEVAKMKAEPGKDMVVWGSISIAQALMRSGLVDEYLLVVCPVALGDGRMLFQDKLDPQAVHLTRVKAFDRGAALLSYEARKTARR